jgi:hypothetical protein
VAARFLVEGVLDLVGGGSVPAMLLNPVDGEDRRAAAVAKDADAIVRRQLAQAWKARLVVRMDVAGAGSGPAALTLPPPGLEPI